MGAFIFALLAIFAALQLASDALYSDAAAPGTFPRSAPPSFGEKLYALLDRIAPAPYVESTLARRALQRGDLAAAQHYALRLPASTSRDGLLGDIASASGQERLALEYWIAAGDSDAIDAAAARLLAANDPPGAYDLERTFSLVLVARATHPDALAQARWQMGLYADQAAFRATPGSAAQRSWLHRALRDFEAATQLAPLSERYAIAAANQADLLAERDEAERLFFRGVEIDPGSADALAGLGVVALERGDVAAARGYLARARARDPESRMVRALERQLH